MSAEIGLMDVDGRKYPNLALMKIAAYHKARGDNVEWWSPIPAKRYDIIYKAKVFISGHGRDACYIPQAEQVIIGGTGYNLESVLPFDMEHAYPDYSLYGITDKAYGFLTRGCPANCPFCIVTQKEGNVAHKVSDVAEFWNGQKSIVLMDPNILACEEHVQLLKQLIGIRARVDFNQGIDCRRLTEETIAVLNHVNLSVIRFAWDMTKDTDAVLRGLNLYTKYGRIQDARRRIVYVLTNYNTTQEENLYRLYKLRELKYNPYVMIYNKTLAMNELRRLQRWVNNKIIWWSCERFYDYKP